MSKKETLSKAELQKMTGLDFRAELANRREPKEKY